jgi:hypothetical protein
MRWVTCVLLAAASLHASSTVSAQESYLKSDVGHPIRIGDATAPVLHEVHFHLPAARLERFESGLNRWRFEPGLSYTILPRIAVEARSSFLYREAGSDPRWGLSGLGLSVFAALVRQRGPLPAIAVEPGFFRPAGPLGSGGTSVSLRVLATRTIERTRVHLNGQYGNYNVHAPAPLRPCTRIDIVFGNPCSGSGPKVPPDVPCGAPVDVAGREIASSACVASADTSGIVATESDEVNLRGARWMIGAGVDHDVAAHAMLIMADVYVEEIRGLTGTADWYAEVGIRKQTTGGTAIELALSRHFLGDVRSWIATVGGSFDLHFGRQ